MICRVWGQLNRDIIPSKPQPPSAASITRGKQGSAGPSLFAFVLIHLCIFIPGNSSMNNSDFDFYILYTHTTLFIFLHSNRPYFCICFYFYYYYCQSHDIAQNTKFGKFDSNITARQELFVWFLVRKHRERALRHPAEKLSTWQSLNQN